MKKYIALSIALAAAMSAPAYGQESVDPKRCQRVCKELVQVESINKSLYDYNAVQNDPAKSDAEKAKSHKDAVKMVCAKTCNVDG